MTIQKLVPSLLFATALALPLVAQGTTATGNAALTVKTADEEIAQGMLANFESEAELPELGSGEHYVITIDDAGAPQIAKGSGEVGHMSIIARPGALMTVFQEQVQQMQMMASMMATMQLQGMGMSAGDAAGFVQKLFAIPREIDLLTVRIDKSDEADFPSAIDVDIQPKAGTSVASFFDALQPTPAGVPSLTGTAAMNVAFGLDMAAMRPLVDRLTPMFAGMVAKDPESRAAFAEMSKQSYDVFDGSGSMLMDFAQGMQMRFVMGAKDPEKMKALIASDEYQKFAASMSEQQGASSKFEPNVFEHAGTPVHKSVTDMSENPMLANNPAFVDGVLTQFFAVAGDYMVMAMGEKGADQQIKTLIDQAPGMKRQKLGDGVLGRMTMDVAAIAAMGGGEVDEDAPQSVNVQFGKKGKGLGLEVRMK